MKAAAITCHHFDLKLLEPPRAWGQGEVYNSVKTWLSDFDFLTAMKNFPHAAKTIHRAMRDLIKVSARLLIMKYSFT